MFDENSLDDLEEIFVYVDLLSSIIAVMVYYDQKRVDEAAEKTIMEEKSALQEQIDEMQSRIDSLEEKIDSLLALLSKT